MIIGTGSLAKLLKDREGVILFASGVGNSHERRRDAFTRERLLLQRINFKLSNRIPIYYFSTLSINFMESPYTKHKQQMENLVKAWYKNYIIIRLGNIWECTNPNTFLNYLRAHPEAEIRENEIKYMIDANTLNMIVHSLPLTGKHEISVFTEMLSVKEALNRQKNG